MKQYRNREACFICSSPYQIIGAIGIVKSEKLDADLYVTGEFPGYDVLAHKLEKYGIFSNVFMASNLAVRGRGKKVSMKMTLFSERVISSYMPKDISYNYYFASSRSTLKATQLAVLRKRNPNIKRIVFDDGLGSYSDNGRLFAVSGLRSAVEKTLGWDLDDPNKTCLMVYLPELISLPEKLNSITVEQMPRIELDDTNRELLSDIFGASEEHNIKERFIIFDAKRRGGNLDHHSEDEKRQLDDYYKLIKQNVGDDCIIKPHPKSSEKPTCLISIYPYQGIPMEVLYLNMKDLENRVLISHVSTAVFTPKILFGCEPTVICLHNLLKDNELSRDFESIYNKFRNTYKDKSRVNAPNSISELNDILKNSLTTETEQFNSK